MNHDDNGHNNDNKAYGGGDGTSGTLSCVGCDDGCEEPTGTETGAVEGAAEAKVSGAGWGAKVGDDTTVVGGGGLAGAEGSRAIFGAAGMGDAADDCAYTATTARKATRVALQP
ncbi:hypothetical protein GUJ93_ZPchr0006g41727 [Zizania palustris]|uniref:Uncharacterized protein n=1 Tax=Zizania palustris TaxID=103762 RepID=A0A8J5VX90_ZIZPA|nr:hypothetical protein GUJ93_ZPchr0006g41727 [Zizania palustris]